MRFAICYRLLNVENVKNAKTSTPPLVFFTFFNLCKWYQIAQKNHKKTYLKRLVAFLLICRPLPNFAVNIK